MITTTQNKQIKQIIKLKKSARERRKQNLFLVEGIRMFTEIPEEYLYKVYASEDFYNEHRVIFEHMDVELVSPQVMKEISSGSGESRNDPSNRRGCRDQWCYHES